jgi:hypothetical protein
MDYQFRLVERGGGNISSLEYKEWRKQGMAFVFEEEPEKPNNSVATQPNMTLISSVKTITREKEKNPSSKSFFGDIVTGPFIAYGLDPKYEAISVEKTKISRPSQELALMELEELIENVDQKTETKDSKASNPIKIKIVFLPLSAERDIKRSSKEFDNKFDVSFIACSVAHLFSTEFARNVVSGGTVILETPLFLLHMSNEIQEKFKEHLRNITASAPEGLKMVNENYENLKTSTVVIKKS